MAGPSLCIESLCRGGQRKVGCGGGRCFPDLSAYSIDAWSWMMKLYVPLIIAHLEPDTVIFAILARIFANKKGMNK
jgi:hypothetical protein